MTDSPKPATPEPATHEPASPTDADWQRAHRIRIQQRFGDTDMLGHLNNSAYLEYLEVGRLALNDEYTALAGEGLMAVLASLSIDFRREAFLGQDTEVLHLIERVGNTSFSYRFRILAAGEVVADGRSVQVQVKDGRPAPLSDTQRRHVEALARRYRSGD